MSTAEIPDVIGTVRGYRSWDLSPDGTLGARYRTFGWQPGVNEARCHGLRSYHLHQVPVENCTCGFYACTDPQSTQIPRSGPFGVVEMSGGIVEHDKNTVIRGGKAQVVAVAMDRHDFTSDQVATVQARYPDIRVFRSRAAMLREYPPVLTAKALKARVKWRAMYCFIGGFQLACVGLDLNNYADKTTGWPILPWVFLLLILGASNVFLPNGQRDAIGWAVARVSRMRRRRKERKAQRSARMWTQFFQLAARNRSKA